MHQLDLVSTDYSFTPNKEDTFDYEQSINIFKFYKR